MPDLLDGRNADRHAEWPYSRRTATAGDDRLDRRRQRRPSGCARAPRGQQTGRPWLPGAPHPRRWPGALGISDASLARRAARGRARSRRCRGWEPRRAGSATSIVCGYLRPATGRTDRNLLGERDLAREYSVAAAANVKRLVILAGVFGFIGLTAACGHRPASATATPTTAQSVSKVQYGAVAGPPELPCVFPSTTELAELAGATD